KYLSYIPGAVLEALADSRTFTPPTLAIASPAGGSSFQVGATVTLTAAASAAGGKSINKVEFFELGKKVGEATTSPFSISVFGLTEDAHEFTARAVDSAGVFAEAAPVNILVGNPAKRATLVAIDDKTSWRYDRSGQDLGTDWRERSYDDSLWPEGKTLIADETTVTVEPIRTPISHFNDNGEYVTTFYFRTHFDLTGAITSDVKLRLRHVVDDGAIFYLNGVEIHRFGFDPDVVVDANTLAAGHENAYEGPFDIPIDSLVPGDNLLAAEVHQSNNSSTDIVFGAELAATYFGTGTTNASAKFNPAVLQAGKIVISWTGAGTLQEANQVTGTYTDVPASDISNNSYSANVKDKAPARVYRLKQ
ncbi:MAG: Ig-like domain-containing protein, partial [Verrucomicrobiota bacterium]